MIPFLFKDFTPPFIICQRHLPYAIFYSPFFLNHSEVPRSGSEILIEVSACMHAQSLQSSLNLCNLMDCSPPGSSVHGILQARMLEWIKEIFPTQGSNLGLMHSRQILYCWASREALEVSDVPIIELQSSYTEALSSRRTQHRPLFTSQRFKES